jgi:nucleoside 2-deoxyribosyltransferase
MTEKCFVCSSADADIENQNTLTHDVRCPQCGRYRVTFSDAESLVELNEEVKPRVSRWIHDQCAHGFKEADRLKEARGESIQGFVAMWFDPQMDAIWKEGLKPAVEDAGYEPIRLDETEHNNKICDEIIAKIRRARFVVADFTGQSSGVYYEAGFAAGLGIPVIFTCRQREVGHEDLHFDVRQFNTIDWTEAADLRSKLTARISATIGDGPRHK